MKSFGQKIKYYREKMGVTQEQFAKKLNISPQAVSKWETNTGYPDLMLIPTIAEYFNISCDTLLTDNGKKEKEIVGDIIYSIKKYDMQNHSEYMACVKLLEDGLERYPCSYSLMRELAYVYSIGSGYPEYSSDGYHQKTIDLCERIYAYSDNSQNKYAAVQLLCCMYRGINNARILELASEMPDIYQSKPALIYHGYDGDKVFEGMHAYFDQLLMTAYSVMTAFVPWRGSEVDEMFYKIRDTVSDRALWVNNYKSGEKTE